MANAFFHRCIKMHCMQGVPGGLQRVYGLSKQNSKEPIRTAGPEPF